eukprot:gene2633-2934_t
MLGSEEEEEDEKDDDEPKDAQGEEQQTVPSHVLQRMKALEMQVQQAYEAGFNAGYTAGAKVQVNVDVDLSSRRQMKPQAAANSNGGSLASPNDTVGKAVGPSAAAMATDSTRQSSVADDSTPLHQEAAAAAAASNNGDTGMSGDSILRSAAKGLVWRLFSTSATVGIALLVLRDVIQVEDALKIGGLEFMAKFVLYFLHERFWAGVKWF